MFKAVQNPEITCFKCLEETEKNNLIEVHIPSMGWGSYFDSWSTKIQLCNDCYNKTNRNWWKLEIIKSEDELDGEFFEFEDDILNFVKNMPIQGQELFFNRFANYTFFMEFQDWIDFELGLLSHEKCKEYGLISPCEIRAYFNKFSKCEYPVNKVYLDGSIGCWCPFNASGESDQTPSKHNISTKCYYCNHFKQRETPIQYIRQDNWNDYELYIKYNLKKDELEEKFSQKEGNL